VNNSTLPYRLTSPAAACRQAVWHQLILRRPVVSSWCTSRWGAPQGTPPTRRSPCTPCTTAAHTPWAEARRRPADAPREGHAGHGAQSGPSQPANGLGSKHGYERGEVAVRNHSDWVRGGGAKGNHQRKERGGGRGGGARTDGSLLSGRGRGGGGATLAVLAAAAASTSGAGGVPSVRSCTKIRCTP
jgi:hypothetical protein